MKADQEKLKNNSGENHGEGVSKGIVYKADLKSKDIWYKIKHKGFLDSDKCLN